MLLGEPPRTQADLYFSLFGIPVRIHPFFWVIALLLGYSGLRDPIDVVTWVVAVLLAVLIHELGHALVMRAYGLQPWITLYGMGGLTSYDSRSAAHTKSSGSLAQILISFAGPAAGFLIAAAIVAGAFATGHRDQVFFAGPGRLVPIIDLQNLRLERFVNQFFFVSVLWGMVNLLPVYPLDGGQIAREIFVAMTPRDGIRASLLLSIVTGAGMAVYGLVQWHSIFVAIMFGYLAYGSYQTLLTYSNRTPWQ